MEKNGLEKMMELIRRQKWEKLFTKRDLVFKTECIEFYKNLKVSMTWKKEVAKSRVNGVEIEIDGMTFATILEIPRNSDLCDYIKEEWEPARYSNPQEITRKFAYDDTILEARRKGENPKRYDYFEETFLTMSQLKRENGVWWLGIGENRRRDDEEVAPTENEEVHEEEQNQEFDWEAAVDEAAVEGESESDDKFYNAQVEVEEPVAEASVVPAFPASSGDSTNVQKEPAIAGVDPSAPTGSIPHVIFSSLQADFERARANRIQADLEKAQAENARLLDLLQQA
ncbi:hypothetical protein Dimus_028955 [Dionaea muscipula]